MSRTAARAPVITDGFVGARRAAAAYRSLVERNLPPNLLWLPVAAVEDAALRAAFDRHAGVRLGDIVAAVGAALSAHAAHLGHRGAIVGFEVWTGLTQVGDAPPFVHRDVDEGRKLAFGLTRHPLASAIVHLGPGRLVGGETMVWRSARVPAALAATLFQRVNARSLLAMGPWHRVAQRAGRLVLFDGAQPHFVCPTAHHPPGRPRLALLMNAWDQPLHGAVGDFGRLEADEFRALTSLGGPALRALVNAAAPWGFGRCALALRAVEALTTT